MTNGQIDRQVDTEHAVPRQKPLLLPCPSRQEKNLLNPKTNPKLKQMFVFYSFLFSRVRGRKMEEEKGDEGCMRRARGGDEQRVGGEGGGLSPEVCIISERLLARSQLGIWEKIFKSKYQNLKPAQHKETMRESLEKEKKAYVLASKSFWGVILYCKVSKAYSINKRKIICVIIIKCNFNTNTRI